MMTVCFGVCALYLQLPGTVPSPDGRNIPKSGMFLTVAEVEFQRFSLVWPINYLSRRVLGFDLSRTRCGKPGPKLESEGNAFFHVLELNHRVSSKEFFRRETRVDDLNCQCLCGQCLCGYLYCFKCCSSELNGWMTPLQHLWHMCSTGMWVSWKLYVNNHRDSNEDLCITAHSYRWSHKLLPGRVASPSSRQLQPLRLHSSGECMRFHTSARSSLWRSLVNHSKSMAKEPAELACALLDILLVSTYWAGVLCSMGPMLIGTMLGVAVHGLIIVQVFRWMTEYKRWIVLLSFCHAVSCCVASRYKPHMRVLVCVSLSQKVR